MSDYSHLPYDPKEKECVNCGSSPATKIEFPFISWSCSDKCMSELWSKYKEVMSPEL